MKLSAVIFDLNGTVLADENEYGKAFSKVLKSLGIEVESKYPHVGGIGVEENWHRFLKKYQIKTSKSIKDLSEETQSEYLKLLPRVTLKKGFKSFVNQARKLGVKTAIATSNTWETVEKIFDFLGIEDLFDSVTTSEEVFEKKPEPQIFQIAAEKLGTIPEECLVLEDSSAGVEAARAAGMKVVGIARSKTHRKELEKADLIISYFDELSLEEINNL